MTTVDWWETSLARNEAEAPSLETRFNKAFVRSIEETIAAVLGRSVAEAFDHHFYAYLGLSREDIPLHLKELFSALNGSFGVGGDVLGRAIVRRLYAELGLSWIRKPNASLVEYVEDAKKMFLIGDRKA